MNLVAAGGHVDTAVDHVVTCNELGSDQAIIIMHRWRHCCCCHMLLLSSHAAAPARVFGADILPHAYVAGRTTVDERRPLLQPSGAYRLTYEPHDA